MRPLKAGDFDWSGLAGRSWGLCPQLGLRIDIEPRPSNAFVRTWTVRDADDLLMARGEAESVAKCKRAAIKALNEDVELAAFRAKLLRFRGSEK